MSEVTARQQSTVRGGVLGLILGDAIGATGGHLPTDGLLPATSAGQLTCFTVDGTIRARVRGTHKGICHPPTVVWHAYTRWAALQGVPGIKRWRDTGWPDGWLAGVPALAVRRGSAPATVATLQTQTMGTTDEPTGTSVGAHALTRSLPVGLLGWWRTEPGRFAADVAALSHAPEAMDVAALGATIVAHLARGQSLPEAVALAEGECADYAQQAGQLTLAASLSAARSDPGRTTVLTRLAPDARARSALAGAVYVVACLPEPGQVRDALLLAASARDGGQVAAVAGALLGAAHGVDALPVDWLSRLELAWVAEVLARDLVSEFVDGPSGDGYSSPADPHWTDRYPGW